MRRQGFRSMPTEKDSGPRTLFLGMQNEMSLRAFVGMLQHNTTVCGVALVAGEVQSSDLNGVETPIVTPTSPSELPLVNRFISESIVQTASDYEIPLVPVSRNDTAKIRQAISSFQPDIACVACFPLRLPQEILDSVEYGFLNLHPSLLPSHRGPEPIFWIFRSADQKASGVTVHRIDEGLDTGDIVLQQKVEFASGISRLTADRICGDIGGALLARAVAGLWAGTLAPYPQPPGGNYDPWPGESDFLLNTSWDAQRAFNFMRGTAHWKRSYPIVVGDDTLKLTEAIAHRLDSRTVKESVNSNDIVFVNFKRGILEARRI